MICILLAIFAAEMAGAQTGTMQRWYAGGGLSVTRVAAQGGYGKSRPGDSSDTDTGFVLLGGYRWSPNFAVEIGYIDGGTPGFSATATQACVAPDSCRLDTTQDITAIDAGVAGILPLGDIWELYIKGGVAFWDATSDRIITELDPADSSADRVDADGVGPMLGLGAAVLIGDRAKLRLDYEGFLTDDDLVDGNRDANFEQFSLQLLWRF